MNYRFVAILLVPVLFYGLLAVRERGRTNTVVKFLQHGDRLSRFNFFATLTSSTAGLASTLLLIAVYGYYYGLGVFVWVILFWWITQWASVKVINRVEAQRPGFWANRGTLHEYLGSQFESYSTRVVAAILTISCFVILLVSEIFLSYRIVYTAVSGGGGAVSFPLTASALSVHGAILVAIFGYAAIAGFRVVVKTDEIQFSIIIAMVMFIIIFLGASLPDLLARHESVFGSTLLASVLNPIGRDPISFIFFFVVMNFLFWVAWWPVAMDQWHRCAATRSHAIPTDKSFGTAGWGARVFVFFLAAAMILIGASTRAYVAPAGNLPDPLPVFLHALMPNGALAFGNELMATLSAGLVLMGLMAAVASTLDSYIIVLVQSVLVDLVISRHGNRPLGSMEHDPEIDRRYLPIARVLVVVWLAIVIVLAFLASRLTLDAFNLVYAGFAFQMTFIPILLVAMFGKPAGKGHSATLGLCAGGIWSAATFPYLIAQLSAASVRGDVDSTYKFLDIMFANTVVVAIVAALAYWLTSLAGGSRFRR